MDQVTRDMCVAQLKNADDHPEKPELWRAAIITSMIAVVDCQYSTGKRVKRIVAGLVILAAIVLLSLLFGGAETIRTINFVRGVGS